MEKSKQSNMIANNDMNRWCALSVYGTEVGT